MANTNQLTLRGLTVQAYLEDRHPEWKAEHIPMLQCISISKNELVTIIIRESHHIICVYTTKQHKLSRLFNPDYPIPYSPHTILQQLTKIITCIEIS